MAQTFRPPYLTALHAPPPGVTLPTEEWESNEPPLETDRHRDQINDLIHTLKWWWRHRRDFYVSGNLTIYYNLDQKTNCASGCETWDSIPIHKRLPRMAGRP